MADRFSGFSRGTLTFLSGLGAHNSKEWFDAHRDQYEKCLVEPAKLFCEAIGKHLKKISKSVRIDPRVNGNIKRMNRDIRFSKDKSPYKDHLDFGFGCGEERTSHPSFFLRITPNLVCVGLGYYHFDGDTLIAYRAAVDDRRKGAALAKALEGVLTIKGYKMSETHYKRVPRGFDPDHPRGELLKLDALAVFVEAKPPREFTHAEFVDWAAGHYKAMTPVFKWLDRLR